MQNLDWNKCFQRVSDAGLHFSLLFPVTGWHVFVFPFFPPSDHPGRPEEEGYTRSYWEESVHRLSARCFWVYVRNDELNSIVACYFAYSSHFLVYWSCYTATCTDLLCLYKIPPVTAGFHDVESRWIIKNVFICYCWFVCLAYLIYLRPSAKKNQKAFDQDIHDNSFFSCELLFEIIQLLKQKT